MNCKSGHAGVDRGGARNLARVGFIATNLARPAKRVVAFYNHRGTCEQYIKEGKGAIKWTYLSYRDEGKAPSFMRHEAGTHRFRCARQPSGLAHFAMDAQKPDNGARLSHNPRKDFF